MDKTTENEGYAIYHDLTIKASLNAVFEAVTEPEHLINWWPLKCTGKPEVGGEYNFYFGPEYDWYGKVIEHSSNKAFHVKMTKADTDWDATQFGFDLDEADGQVQLKFWHIGWPECNAHYRKSSFCWALLLNSLKELC